LIEHVQCLLKKKWPATVSQAHWLHGKQCDNATMTGLSFTGVS
jgi:hypothetical protein